MVVELESKEPIPISMVCKANRKTSLTVHVDEPIILSVAMVNDAAVTAASHNAPLEEEIQILERRYEATQMEEEDFKRAVEEIKQRMIKATIYRIGGPKGWPQFIEFKALSRDNWKVINWPLKLLKYLPKTQVVTLDANSCYAEYGLDPEDTKRPQGEFKLKALVKITKDEIIESNVVILNLLKDKMTEDERSKEEYLITRARYAYKGENFDEARGFVQKALKINPSSLPALNLYGDIEHKLGNLPEALSAYERAFEEFKKQLPQRREPPFNTIKKITRLRAMIGE
jgi:tetratricopeptide (TPR) repeat protein